MSRNDSVTVSVPARAESLSIVRLVLGGVGARAGFTLEAIDELQLAVDELCSCLVIASEDSTTRIAVTVSDTDPTSIECATIDWRGDEPQLSALSSRILETLVDEHGIRRAGDEWVAWLTVARTDGRSER